MLAKNKLLLLLLFALSTDLLAAQASYYPKASFRTLGVDQGHAGSCRADAEITAFETAFINRGYNVKLSTFYRHAFNWKDNDTRSEQSLSYGNSEIEFLNRVGPIIPNYMYPETGEGLNTRISTFLQHKGIRPSPSDMAVIDPDFPNAFSLGFNKEWKTFEKGFGNSKNLDDLLEYVAAGRPIVMAIHSQFLFSTNGYFNSHTGLLARDYSKADLLKTSAAMNRSYNIAKHAVAVLGFDDSLYQDLGYSRTGAVIIRNSWNDRVAIEEASRQPQSNDEREDLARFRLKIAATNLPGYFAIPYQYIIDLIAHDEAESGFGFNVYDLNFDYFWQVYHEFESRYATKIVPFVCRHSDSTFTSAQSSLQSFSWSKSFMKNRELLTRQREDINDLIQQLVALEPRRSGSFKYAVLPSTQAVDRVENFYRGDYKSFYCPSSEAPGEIVPNHAVYQSYQAMRDVISYLSQDATSLFAWLNVFHSFSEMDVFK